MEKKKYLWVLPNGELLIVSYIWSESAYGCIERVLERCGAEFLERCDDL